MFHKHDLATKYNFKMAASEVEFWAFLEIGCQDSIHFRGQNLGARNEGRGIDQLKLQSMLFKIF